MTNPSRDTAAGRAYLDLQNKARREGRPTDEMLSLYALEGFLDRLSGSRRASELVLKGGVLLAAFGTRRPTRDVDLQAQDLANDVDTVLALVREIASTKRDDGLIYNIETATAETIRDEDAYSGVRVSMTCQLATALLTFHVDINVGDPIWPAHGLVEIPRLLGGSISVLGYPLAMVLAEKIVTAIQRGTANTRWRDGADIYLLSGRHEIDGTQLHRSLVTVATHRGAAMTPLSDVLAGYVELAKIRWAAWVRKQRLGDRLPIDLGDLLAVVIAFADPALVGEVDGMTWIPADRAWIR